jgi:hypothetical protein
MIAVDDPPTARVKAPVREGPEGGALEHRRDFGATGHVDIAPVVH